MSFSRCCAVALFAAALPAQRDPGSTTTFRWDPLGADLQVFVPRDYAPSQEWPVVVHYHGTGGQPNLGPTPAAADGKGFVVVGTTYLKRGLFRAGAETVDAEWKTTKAMLKELDKELELDLEAIYVSGFSKGGWVAGMILEQYPDEIAGAWVGGAGITTAKRKLPKGVEVPVYIGVGETDVNRIASLQAVPAWRKRKAMVTYDEYPGVGHSYEITKSCRDWFEIERQRGVDGFNLPSQAALQRAAAMIDQGTPWEQYQRLQGVLDGPWAQVAMGDARKAAVDQLKKLAKEPTLKKEMAAKRAYEKILRQEISQRGKPVRARSVVEADKKVRAQKDKLLAGYEKVVKKYGATFYGKKANGDVARVKAQIGLMGR